MNHVDLSPILAPVLGVVGTILATVTLMLVKRGLDLLQTRTGIKLTEDQRGAILSATQTATGMVTAEMTKGAMSVADLHTQNANVIAAGNYILNAAPEAAAALGITQEKAVQMVVGKVGNALAADPTVPTVAGTQTQPSTVVNSAPVLVVDDAGATNAAPPGDPTAPVTDIAPVKASGLPFVMPNGTVALRPWTDGNGARG